MQMLNNTEASSLQ